MNTSTKEKVNGLLSVVMVGFPFPTSSFIENYDMIAKDGKKVIEFHHPLESLAHFESVDASEIFAIIIDLPVLEKDNYRFLEVLRKDPELDSIPVIAVAPGWTNIDRKVLMQKGLDDCYVEPIDWQKLESRILFLRDFKVHKHLDYKPSDTEYKLPLWKRAFDIAASLGALVILTIPFLILALIIKATSKGPVFYLSDRAGTGYKIFKFIKFRSMAEGADQQIKELAHLNNYGGEAGDGPVFVKLKNDPRVTKIGRWIRRTSVDELPQILNVLKGDMSVVGNRPLPLYEAEQLTKDAWATRFIAPAGLTGIWQTAPGGKVNVSNEDRIKMDIEYAENINFWTDFKIILRTFSAMIQKGE